ncbi:hypothetical protein STEG23_031065, partial [Scotinomys teguina]
NGSPRPTFILHADELLHAKAQASPDHSSTYDLWPPMVLLSVASCQAPPAQWPQNRPFCFLEQ